MTKIDIYSGFLGAGKTTLIKKMIQEAYHGQKLVLIENEFGEIGIDGGFLQEAGIEITEMNSGCICCSLVGGRYGFPAAQRLVADYVVKNYEQIPFLSITALAQNCGVSEKTVVKFCNSLGFEKFTEFKRTFSAYAQSKLIITNKLSSAPAPDGDVFERTMRQDISAIEKTMTLPENREALSDAVRRILAAKRVYVTGGRASAALAALLASMLRYLGLQVQELLPGACDYYDRLMTVRPDDLVITICFSRYTAQIAEGAAFLHAHDVPIVLMTDLEPSPLYAYAACTLQCEASAEGYFPCYAGCLSILYALCSTLGSMRGTDAAEHARELERVLLDRGVFL